MSDWQNCIRDDLKNYQAYQSAGDVTGKNTHLKLNANELPLALTDFTAQFSDVNRYPKKLDEQTQHSIAQYYGVAADHCLLTCGSDEGIDLLLRLFCQANKDKIIINTPTFGMYEKCACLQGAGVIKLPLLGENLNQLDMDNLYRLSCEAVKLIFICSPNNPTGAAINTQDILSLCEHYTGKAIIVVDEAYAEFSDEKSLSQYLAQYSNLVILRTLSKAFGLAQLRAGFVLAVPSLLQWLKKISLPYPIAGPVLAALPYVFQNDYLTKVKNTAKQIVNARDKWQQALAKLPFVKKVFPSDANFLLCQIEQSTAVVSICQQAGIAIRDFAENIQAGENHVRITIGTEVQFNQLMSVLLTI